MILFFFSQGQPKDTVKPFYDRLWELGLTNCYPPHAGTPYPWSNNTNAPHHYALANIGQAKYAFSFDLSGVNITTNTDSDADGLPDWWELPASGSRTGANLSDDPNGDGLTNAERLQLGLGPTQHVNVVTLGPGDISFEVKAVESHRSKTIGFQDFVSQTNTALTPSYFLQQARSSHYSLDDPNTVVWNYDYTQQLAVPDGQFSGSWSYDSRYIRNGGEPGCASDNYYGTGSAQWISNGICTGHAWYTNNFNVSHDDSWSNVSHGAPHSAEPCGGSGGFEDWVFNHLLYGTETSRVATALTYTLRATEDANTTGTDSWTLSGEFTTAILNQIVTNDLSKDDPFNNLAWGRQWTYDFFGVRTEDMISDPTSYRELSADEIQLDERRLLYRALVATNQCALQAGTYYKVNLAHIFTPNSTNGTAGDTNIPLDTHTWRAQYTGGSQLVFNVANTLLDVPPSNGVVSVNAIKVKVGGIVFNYDSTKCSEDGLNIRQDYNTPIGLPEFVRDLQTNAAAYLVNTAVKILVRLNLETPNITSLRIKGVSANRDGVLGDTEEKLVYFCAGVSQTGEGDDPNWPEFIKFSLNGTTPNKICVSTNAWNWIVTEVNGIAVDNLMVDQTSGHIVYTVLAVPAPPWTQAPDNPCNPWASALGLVCDKRWAGGASTSKQAAGKIIEQVYRLGEYPVIDKGKAQHTDNSGNLDLSSYIVAAGMQMENCQDVAGVVCALGNVVGCSNDMIRLARWLDWPFKSNTVAPLPGGFWTNDSMAFHYVVTGADGIYDATFEFKYSVMLTMWAEGISLNDYLNLLVPSGESQPSPGTPSKPIIH